MPNTKWTVLLSLTHRPYTQVELKRSRDHVDGYEVVMVDLNCLMTCFERDQLTIPQAEAWKVAKRDGIREFLDPAGGACEMPVIGFSLRTKKYQRFFGLLPARVEEVLVASFTNGRHRARYLQFAGAAVIPVEVHKSEADLLWKFCGAG